MGNFLLRIDILLHANCIPMSEYVWKPITKITVTNDKKNHRCKWVFTVCRANRHSNTKWFSKISEEKWEAVKCILSAYKHYTCDYSILWYDLGISNLAVSGTFLFVLIFFFIWTVSQCQSMYESRWKKHCYNWVCTVCRAHRHSNTKTFSKVNEEKRGLRQWLAAFKIKVFDNSLDEMDFGKITGPKRTHDHGTVSGP